MVAAEGVVALHVAVEAVEQRVLVQGAEVVRLAEGVHRELPVARDVVVVSVEVLELVEAPVRDLVSQLGRQQRIDVDRAVGIGMHPQQAVALDRRQPQQAVAGDVDVAEVIGLRQADERTTVVVGPGVEGAAEPPGRTPLVGHDLGAPVPARVDERDEGAVGVASGDDRHVQLVDGEERTGLGQVARESDHLRVVAEEHLALARREIGVDVGARGVAPYATGVDVGARIESLDHLVQQAHLILVSHSSTPVPWRR